MSFSKVQLFVTVTLLVTFLVKAQGKERKGKAFASYTNVQTPYHSYTTFHTKHGIKSEPFQNHPTFATQHVETPFEWYKTDGYKPANVNLPFKSFLTKPNQESHLKRINKPARIPIPVKIVTARPVQIKKYGYKLANVNLPFKSFLTKPDQASQIKKTNKPTRKLIPVTGGRPKATAKPAQIKKIKEETEEEDMVLDFSSGTAQVSENNDAKIKELSEEEAIEAGVGAFSKFRELIDKVGIVKEVERAGNVTIFTPFNEAFDKLPTKLEDLPLSTQRKIVLKHFVKGFLPKKDIKNGPIQTLGGEFITLVKNADTNKVKIFSQSGQSNVKVSNVKTKFGLVNIIDTILT